MISKTLTIRFTFFLLLFVVASSLTVFSQFAVPNIMPTTITAGTGSVLTITGTGFGAFRGPSSYVSFPSASVSGSSSVVASASDYVSWTDTKIEVKVPAGVVTGLGWITINNAIFIALPSLTINETPKIASLSPTDVVAGVDLLTINGEGFGTVPGYVNFKYTETGGSGTFQVSGAIYIMSWTNTKIVVRVPTQATSGRIEVITSKLITASSSSPLIVKYSIYNTNQAVPFILANLNKSGGYTFRLSDSFAANTPAAASFKRALDSWTCSTGVNWAIGSLTDPRAGTFDDNIVKFGGASDIVYGTLAFTGMGWQKCANGQWELIDVDLTFNNQNYNWNYGHNDPASNQYDLETIALHELGHAQGLWHVNDAAETMHYDFPIGTKKRSLSAKAIEGGNYILANSTANSSGSCYTPMTRISNCGTLPPIITSINPSTANPGSVVTIKGSNLAYIMDVKFGGVSATSFTMVSPTTLTAVVGTGASGNVTVLNPGGTGSLAGFNFTTKTLQTLNYNVWPVKTYRDPDFDPEVTSTSGLPVTYSSTNSNVATIVNNKVHIVGAGLTTIIASQSGNATYALISVNLSLTVNKAAQAITMAAVPTKLTSDPDFDLNAVVSSGLALSYTSSNPAVATIVNGRVHLVAAGITTITVFQSGDNNFNAALPISIDLTVNNLPQSITFPDIVTKKVNDEDFDPGATASSGLAITYTSSDLSVATVVNNKIHIVGAGNAIITASQAGNSTYASSSKQVVLTVIKLVQTLSFPNLSAKDVNATDFDPGATVSSGLPIAYTSSNTNVASILAGKIHILGAGTTTITATQAGDAIYSAVSVSVNLTINKLVQSINLPQIATKTFNDADFDLNATVSSGLIPTYSSSNSNVAIIVNNKVHIVGAGTTSITASQPGNATYEATSSSVNLTVNKLQQTITFSQIALKSHNDADFDLNASASSGLPVSYSSSNTAVATIIAGKLHIVAGGAAVITASQPGNANINAAPDVLQNLDVTFTIPVSNFTVKSTDESCKTSNNGAINITATQILSYTAVVTVNGTSKTYPFNSVLAVNNLEAGSYTVCITVAGQPAYKQCFDVVVKEPKDLAVYSNIRDNGNSVFLKLEGGERYIIDLNGKIVTTSNQEITLPLLKGNNIVKIAADKPCQGVITKTFLTSNGILLYPNPVKNTLNINIGSSEQTTVKVEIHALDGRLTQRGEYIAEFGQVAVDLSKLNKGLYVLTLSIGNSKTVHKVLKD
jgi:hypothetical protein